MKSSQTPRIAISIGDFNGIGPEIILKYLAKADLSISTPVILAPKKVITFYRDLLSLPLDIHFAQSIHDINDQTINVCSLDVDEPDITPGKHSKKSGKVAMAAIEQGIRFCMNNNTHALVTAPISKEAVNLAGYHIPGHTEFLAEKTGTPSVLMMLVSGGLRVSLVTTHIPISEVAGALSSEVIENKIDLLHQSLVEDFGISEPRIAVFGLNPHAGDGGVIGREEMDLITPLLKEVRQKGMNAEGPFPADGFFGQKLQDEFDGILAMYHDQGLAPFKALSFGKGVNFTAGLPIIRTSPDHGTAFDIAGKGVANPSSFAEAYALAVELSNKKLRE